MWIPLEGCKNTLPVFDRLSNFIHRFIENRSNSAFESTESEIQNDFDTECQNEETICETDIDFTCATVADRFGWHRLFKIFLFCKTRSFSKTITNRQV